MCDRLANRDEACKICHSCYSPVLQIVQKLVEDGTDNQQGKISFVLVNMSTLTSKIWDLLFLQAKVLRLWTFFWDFGANFIDLDI